MTDILDLWNAFAQPESSRVLIDSQESHRFFLVGARSRACDLLSGYVF